MRLRLDGDCKADGRSSSGGRNNNNNSFPHFSSIGNNQVNFSRFQRDEEALCARARVFCISAAAMFWRVRGLGLSAPLLWRRWCALIREDKLVHSFVLLAPLIEGCCSRRTAVCDFRANFYCFFSRRSILTHAHAFKHGDQQCQTVKKNGRTCYRVAFCAIAHARLRSEYLTKGVS